LTKDDIHILLRKHNKKIEIIDKKLEDNKKEIMMLSITGEMRLLYPVYKEVTRNMLKLDKAQISSLKERLHIHS